MKETNSDSPLVSKLGERVLSRSPVSANCTVSARIISPATLCHSSSSRALANHGPRCVSRGSAVSSMKRTPVRLPGNRFSSIHESQAKDPRAVFIAGNECQPLTDGRMTLAIPRAPDGERCFVRPAQVLTLIGKNLPLPVLDPPSRIPCADSLRMGTVSLNSSKSHRSRNQPTSLRQQRRSLS